LQGLNERRLKEMSKKLASIQLYFGAPPPAVNLWHGPGRQQFGRLVCHIGRQVGSSNEPIKNAAYTPVQCLISDKKILAIFASVYRRSRGVQWVHLHPQGGEKNFFRRNLQ